MSIIDSANDSDGAMRVEELAPEAFVRYAAGQTFTTVAAARVLTPPGGDTALAHGRIRGLANMGALHRQHRRGSGPAGPALYAVDDLAVAAICFQFYDLKLADRHLISTIEAACHGWVERQPEPLDSPGGASPAWAALRGVARGEVWQLHLGVYPVSGGRKMTVARVHRDDWRPGLPDTATESAIVEIRVGLNRVLAPLLPFLPPAG